MLAGGFDDSPTHLLYYAHDWNFFILAANPAVHPAFAAGFAFGWCIIVPIAYSDISA